MIGGTYICGNGIPQALNEYPLLLVTEDAFLDIDCQQELLALMTKNLVDDLFFWVYILARLSRASVI